MADLYVSTSGSDSGSGTSSSPFRTIAKASQMAQPGTTVHVAPGTYEGGFSTSKSGTASAPITYVSDVKWGAKIVPPGNSGNGVAWNNRGDYVHIEGFEVDGTNHKSGTPWNFGIYTTGTGSVVEDNKVHDIATRVGNGGSSGGAGIEGDGYYGDTNIKLLNNVVYDIGAGVGSSGTIQGIYHTTTGEVSGNTVHNVAAAGISLWHDARNIEVSGNTVHDSDFGIWVGGGDYVTGDGPADNIRVSDNVIYDNARYGIAEGGDTGRNNVYVNNDVSQNGTDWRLQNGLKPTSTEPSETRADPAEDIDGAARDEGSTTNAGNAAEDLDQDSKEAQSQDQAQDEDQAQPRDGDQAQDEGQDQPPSTEAGDDGVAAGGEDDDVIDTRADVGDGTGDSDSDGLVEARDGDGGRNADLEVNDPADQGAPRLFEGFSGVAKLVKSGDVWTIELPDGHGTFELDGFSGLSNADIHFIG
ncbi:right-handed parallel beta-helix repeat-containing protein [Arenibaculum pallidiluteum]|uniref:right-handed parallel beta-helix repeat-containing protein n=1 Tax=Arenibaculum pallidiluteum TaxID=2812559 RepID=UPI001A96E944|nr:right-handed parallel beta-helix repeat-containing protein [Arenibaculum pallidiluteum]